MNKKVIAAIALSLLLSVLSVTAAKRVQATRGASRIGYVSMQRILNEATAAKADAGRFEVARQEKMKDVTAKQKALEATLQQVAHAHSANDGPTAERLTKIAQDQKADLDRATSQAQADLQTLQREVGGQVRAQLKSVLDQLAARNNVQIVLNEDTGVIWAAPGSDLTADVISQLNASSAKPQAKP